MRYWAVFVVSANGLAGAKRALGGVVVFVVVWKISLDHVDAAYCAVSRHNVVGKAGNA